jgi:cysteine dioxygenase
VTSKVEAFLAELDRHEGAVPLDVLTEHLERLDITPDDVREHVRFGPGCYQRNLMHVGPGYQALILCWGPGQCSVIHDHRGSACGVRVLRGVATETIYDRGPDGMLVERERVHREADSVCGSFDADIHRISNDSETVPLVTVHIYSPPLLRAGTYRLDSAEIGEWADPNGSMADRGAGAGVGVRR